MGYYRQRDAFFRLMVVANDLIFMNGLFLLFYFYRWHERGLVLDVFFGTLFFAWNTAYLIGMLIVPPVAHHQVARAAEMARRSFLTGLIMQAFFLIPLQFLGFEIYHHKMLAMVLVANILLLFVSRFFSRWLCRMFRRTLSGNDGLVFVGSTDNVIDLYDAMMLEMWYSHHPMGYFDETPSEKITKMDYLGTVNDVIPFLQQHEVRELYCALSQEHSKDIKQIMTYCENHLVRFYAVPNVSNYVHNQMNLDYIGDYPVLSIHEEPLRQPINAFVKRAFDVVFSSLFLCTLFIPIYIWVAIVIKRSSPGPVFFKQLRNGLNGEEFYCLKFRSMHVNKDADRLQATENDPRKFKFGDFLRRSSIDELPQFINVLKGEMSVVGPRPHMLKHTEEYSELIDKYMVRHFAKPGITGWAQVNGCRGETRELWQMENRIRKDIWYVEHWSFWLDLLIIWKTVANALLHKDEQAY